MALIVQKYGGTSLGSLDCIGNVAQRILKYREMGDKLVVIVSAMGSETDRLISLAKAIHEQPEPREYAALVSTGEQVSMSLLCMELIKHGCSARSYTGGQVKIYTDSDYQQARIVNVEVEPILADLDDGRIVVVAGFQGVDARGDITTLGRGGSDTTAVALAAALKADECQIYTDVEGIYTADPRLVPNARCLDSVTFEEMLELSSLGAKVLHSRAVQFAGRYKVPLRVLSSFKDTVGTLISFKDDNMEQPLITGVTYNAKEASISILGIPSVPGIEYQILGAVTKANIPTDMIFQSHREGNSADFTITVNREDCANALKILDKVAADLGAQKVVANKKVSKLSIIGVGIRSHIGVSSKMFETLGKEGITIRYITASEIKISVVIDEEHLKQGLQVLHCAFNLDKKPLDESITAKLPLAAYENRG